MTAKNALSIGTFIRFHPANFYSLRSTRKREMEIEDISLTGVIVGGCWKQTGSYCPRFWDNGGYIYNRTDMFVYEVRCEFTTRPQYAHPSLSAIEELTSAKIPFRRVQQESWSDRDRQNLRVEMINWPRDKKGRWTRKT